METARKNTWELLGLSPGGLFVIKVSEQLWGKYIDIYLRYTFIDSLDKNLHIHLSNCEKIQKELFSDSITLKDATTQADVVGLSLGVNHFAKPLILTTTFFELIVIYDDISWIIKDF